MVEVLISGASVAGPVLAFWLAKQGHAVTVVERVAGPRKTGGHAVDLFRPAMEILRRMGVDERVRAKATGIDRVTVLRGRSQQPVEVRLDRIYTAISDDHVEIMRDDLSEILYETTCDDVEYVFVDSITSVSEQGEVTFEKGQPRGFDLVVGADGLHSTVRRLVFDEESRYTSWLGAYLSVLSIPKDIGPEGAGHMLGYLGVGRLAGVYSTEHLDDARAVFLFRTQRPLDYYYRDIARQKDLLRQAFTGVGGEVSRWLSELDRTPAFYFDSITQVHMDTWSRGRVTLVGDAAYGPGPAVGGGTSLAVVGSYVLAGELAEAHQDQEPAFAAYEREIGPYVHGARKLGRRAARALMSVGRVQVWAVIQGARLLSRLPPGLPRALAKLGTRSVRLHDSVVLKDYSMPRRRSA